MATRIRVQVLLTPSSGLPEDVRMNTLYFQKAVVPFTLAEFDSVRNEIANFYGSIGPGMTRPLSDYMGEAVIRTASAHVVKYYDLDVPGSAPVYVSNFSIPAPSGLNTAERQALPEECSVCLSYRSDYGGAVEKSGSTRPRSRHRGRIYFGPLNASTIEPSFTLARPKSVMLSNLRVSAQLRLSTPLPGIEWCQDSPTDGVLRTIIEVSTDDAFDTQRRRGVKPQLRVRQPA
jgi:hypothetical protein